MTRHLPALIARLTDEQLAERVDACKAATCYDDDLVKALDDELFARERKAMRTA